MFGVSRQTEASGGSGVGKLGSCRSVAYIREFSITRGRLCWAASFGQGGLGYHLLCLRRLSIRSTPVADAFSPSGML